MSCPETCLSVSSNQSASTALPQRNRPRDNAIKFTKNSMCLVIAVFSMWCLYRNIANRSQYHCSWIAGERCGI